MDRLFQRKTLEQIHEEMAGDNRLRRVLGPVSLTALGVGTIIGTGIFVLVGIAAHDKTGPAIVVSFMVSGMACIFAALCYAEFASMAPVSGSAYTYAYTTMGEMFAWFIGWDLILEYCVASATVAHGWSKYFQSFLSSYDIHLPKAIAEPPFDLNPATHEFFLTGGIVDLPAILITMLLTIVLIVGIRESAWLNGLIVIVKLLVVFFVIIVGAFFINPDNWKPFAPYGWKGLSFFGDMFVWGANEAGKPMGMIAGAGIIFFAYIGFDSVSTHAEEAKNPKRDVPIGIIASLLLCTVLYILVAGVLTGMVRYDEIDVEAPVASAFATVGLPWAQRLVAIGAIAGITSVLLVLMLSSARVLLALARDGLIPSSFFGAVHPKFRTPWLSSLATALVVGLMAAFIPLRVLAELVNIGTLLAFVVVCVSVLIMRKMRPDMPRPFRCPFSPWLPMLGAGMCLMLMFSLPSENWFRLLIWFALGVLIYFGYGIHHSELSKRKRSGGK